MKITKPIVPAILLMCVFFAIRCQTRNPFSYASLSDAIQDLEDTCNGDVVCTGVDTDDDGIVDGIDTDGDGDPDVDVDPPTIDPNQTPPPDETPPPTGTPTPPVVRDGESGQCIPLPGPKVPNVGSTVVVADVVDPTSTTIYLSFNKNGQTITFDFTGMNNLARVITISHASSNSRINVTNADMSAGICNEGMSGTGNVEYYDATNSALVADLVSGTGNGNTLQLDFQPISGLRYALGGNSHCLSVPDNTWILKGTVNNGSHTVNLDGTPCLP